MSWFKRIKEGITTSTDNKKETPDGLWYKCPKCKEIVTTKDHKKIYIVVLSVTITVELDQMNILKFYLIKINIQSLMQIWFQ